jgi:hypothetical protein
VEGVWYTPLGYITSCRNPSTGTTHNKKATFRLNSATTSQLHSFAVGRFHFKELFNFPSRYLFPIGLTVVFSLTRNLPGTSTCTPKQVYSTRLTRLVCPEQSLQGSHLLWRLTQENLWLHKGESKHQVINVAPLSSIVKEGLHAGLHPSSLAVTGGITFLFFSSAQ